MSLIDEDRILVKVNPAKADFLRYSPEELEGKPLEHIVVPEQRAAVKRAWQRAAEQEANKFNGEYDVLRGDGERLRVHYAAERADVNGRLLFVYLELGAEPSEDGHAETRTGMTGALTEREREVVQLIALGSTGPEIAGELVLSHDTVRTHVRNAMEKTGAKTRAQLVAMVLGERLL
jgi:PAS domain S-box-containing protein